MARRSARKRPFRVTAVVVLQTVSILALTVDIYRVKLVNPASFCQEARIPDLSFPWA